MPTTDISVQETGKYHNINLTNIYDAIKQNAIFSPKTRGMITVEEYAQCLADVEVEILKNSNQFKTMSSNKVPSFIQSSLDITLSDEQIKSQNSLLKDPGYSLTESLKIEFPDKISPIIEGYLNDLINIFKQDNEYISIENEIVKNNLKWYPLADNEDREIISSTNNVAKSSLNYWRTHANQWNVGLHGNPLRGYIIGVTTSDFCSVARLIYIGRQYSIIFWKEIAMYAAACSAQAAVEGIVSGVIDWVLCDTGYELRTANNSTNMSREDFSQLVTKYCVEKLSER